MTSDQTIRVEAFNDYVLSSIATGILVVDLASKVIYVNREAGEILEIEADELVGRPLLTVPRFFPMVPLINDHRKNNPSLEISRRQVEASLTRLDGTELPLGFTITNLTNEVKTVLGYVIVFRDLTEITRLKKLAKRSETLAAIGTMAAGVAHEIRNPLHAIRASVELIKFKLAKDKPVDDYLEIIFREVERLNRIVEDILTFSRDTKISTSPVDVNSFLSRRQGMFGCPEGMSLELRLAQDLPRIPVDSDKLLQVLMNLARNAFEAMNDGGCVEISTTLVNNPSFVDPRSVVSNEFVRIDIKDDGPGIPLEDLGHIFEPFFSKRKRKTEGTGLGLPICQKIVEAHCGYLDVSSVLGEGTCFSIFLPLRTGVSVTMANQGTSTAASPTKPS
jgi:PAS domain S-box-containing protein